MMVHRVLRSGLSLLLGGLILVLREEALTGLSNRPRELNLNVLGQRLIRWR